MKRSVAFFLALALIFSLAACGQAEPETEPATESITEPVTESAPATESEASELLLSDGKIYLYGESHGVEAVMDKEFELWYDYYHNEGLRHLFIEYAYYHGELLNAWMQEDSDDILDTMYDYLAGTQAQVPYLKVFLKKIKSECPETVFHGTDVGHQHNTIGAWYLGLLEEQGLKDSEQYALAQQSIAQGKEYYKRQDNEYRENMMAENFIREFDALQGESVMGIYGAAHTSLDGSAFYTPDVPCMGNQLGQRYGDAVYSEDISLMGKDIEPLRVDTIEVNGKEYAASYFGEDSWSTARGFMTFNFWRLEEAYDDFKDCERDGNVLPYNNYIMAVEAGQVFVIDCTEADGSVTRHYYISDGHVWNGQPATEEFMP